MKTVLFTIFIFLNTTFLCVCVTQSKGDTFQSNNTGFPSYCMQKLTFSGLN